MLKNYLKIALRNLLKHKGYTFINVAGLAAGMYDGAWLIGQGRVGIEPVGIERRRCVENLADPVMAFDRNPISTSYLDHVFESREGARGAVGSGGGGCGCN